MNTTWRLLTMGFVVLMTAGPTAAATPEVNLVLVRGQNGGQSAGEIPRICPNESNFEVYSPELVIHTVKAEEMADPPAMLQKVFGQRQGRVVFEHTLACGNCPEGTSSGASVSTTLDGREYALGVLFPRKGENQDIYRVRIQEARALPAGEKKGSTVGAVIPPTILNVPVRCPRGHVAVVGFSDVQGKPLFLMLKPRELADQK